jgi:hypothetical protein
MFFSSFVMSHVRENFYFGTFQSFKIFLWWVHQRSSFH